MKTLLALWIVAIAALGQNKTATLSPADETRLKEAAREFIKDRLKAPATAVFSKETVCSGLGKPDFEEAKGTGPTPECTPAPAADATGFFYGVYRASVDAQNSYGALIRTKYQIQVQFKNSKWGFSDAAESVKLLFEGCMTIAEGDTNRRSAEAVCKAQFPNAQ